MQPVRPIRFSRIAAGVFCGLAIALSVHTAAGAQNYVPDLDLGQKTTTTTSTTTVKTLLKDAQVNGVSGQATTTSTSTTTTSTTTATTLVKDAQVKGVTLQAVNPAFTGANTVPVAGLGALALGTGVVLRVAARKRKAR